MLIFYSEFEQLTPKLFITISLEQLAEQLCSPSINCKKMELGI